MDGIGSDDANLEVVDPEGVYKPDELECEGGMAVGGGPPVCTGGQGKEG